MSDFSQTPAAVAAARHSRSPQPLGVRAASADPPRGATASCRRPRPGGSSAPRCRARARPAPGHASAQRDESALLEERPDVGPRHLAGERVRVVRRRVDDLVLAVVLEAVRVVGGPASAQSITAMPGNPSSSRSAWTSGVITPRSSAITGSGPSSASAASKSARARARRPPSLARVSRPRRHRPVAGEAAEVVDAEQSTSSSTRPHPLDPPAVAGRARAPPSRRAGCPRADRAR